MLIQDLESKISEQIERTSHMAGLVPEGNSEWRPPGGGWSVGDLLGHLLDCMAGFCAVLQKARPEELSDMDDLRRLPVNHACGVAEARSRFQVYDLHIRRAFALLRDEDLDRKMPTVFVPGGESLLTLLLGNLEHLINHKHQLFTMLKQMGIPVSTRDLYRFRA